MEMLYSALYPALAFALAGLVVRAFMRLRATVGTGVSIGDKLAAIPRIFIRGFNISGLLDVLLLARSTSGGPGRWITAMLIHAGFIGLLLVHAFGPQVAPLFGGEFEATINPYFFLRDLFGLLLIAGLLAATVRRLTIRRIRQTSAPLDWAMLAIVAGIGISGVVWQASKSISPAAFDRMAEEYFIGEEEELNALKAVWAVDYDVVFPERPQTSASMLASGREADEESCRSCHSPAASAFLSHAVAQGMKSLASSLNETRADKALGHLHALFILAGILLLPFGKFAHPLTTPLNLLIRKGRRISETESHEAREEVIRGAGIAACTHCGECAVRCSVGAMHDVLGISQALPSEKLIDLATYSSDRLPRERLHNFMAGSRVCSECLRCTEVCPSGIDLQNLWLASKQRMRENGQGGLQHDMPHQSPAQRMNKLSGLPHSTAEKHRPEKLTARRESFLGCVQCTTCTSVCPVVAASANPARDLDFTPQQVMNLLRMGLVDQALGAGMTWNCVTCYKCQEHCPQGVPVADVLFELRNIANARMRSGDKGEA